MKNLLNPLKLAIEHLDALDSTFESGSNYDTEDEDIKKIYSSELAKFEKVAEELGIGDMIYSSKGRQMMLSDIIEYLFFGRGYYSISNGQNEEQKKGQFIEAIMHFVNLLMSFEAMTVSYKLRSGFLKELGSRIPETRNELLFDDLLSHKGTVGLPEKVSDASRELNRYFDTLLPKTAGGLWHEMLSFIFLLRSDVGYIVPLLLSQRFFGRHDHIVPPDFLIIGKDKRMYGIEVGTKKEIQSGGFSLKTAIPTATFDTINSRNSDRCPICHKWIHFCDYVVKHYSNLDMEIPSDPEVRCLRDCDVFEKKEILQGKCPFTKYSRDRRERIKSTHHDYADGLHYHYRCVLNKVPHNVKEVLVHEEDEIALTTHFPYYQGLEQLID